MFKSCTTHKLFLAILFTILINLSAKSQIRNALSFDGIDDKVVVNNGSSLIANSSNMSLSVWVKSDSSNFPFPDFNGLAGFRNDNDADFYLIQIYAGQVEGRFSNSANQHFTLTINGVQANVWQHFALTYDGSYLRIYSNGYIADSIAASGTISSTTQPFNIGFLPFGTSPFYTQGLIDEVSLFNRTLNDNEIGCLMNYGPSLDDADLKLEFNCNQGIPGGNNSAITILKDQSNHLNGAFTGMPKTGATSNFVLGQALGQTSFEANICGGQPYQFWGHNYTTSGIFDSTFVASNNCDSTVVLTLNVTSINTGVLQNNNILASAETGVTYQWVDCNNNFAPLTGPGTTGQIYTAHSSGSYAVVLTKGNCSDTSNCFPVTVGINELNNNIKYTLVPNPVKTNLQLSFEKLFETVHISIFSVEGRLISEGTFMNQKDCLIELKNVKAGTYLLKIRTPEGSMTRMFEKTE